MASRLRFRSPKDWQKRFAPTGRVARPRPSAINDPLLNDAAPDTVLVCAGTYGGGADSNPVALANRAGLDLIGARAGQDARTRTSGPESLISDPDGGIVATVNDITIDGFDVRDAQQTYFAGIYLTAGTSNHRVINNVVRDNGEGLALGNGSAGQTVIRNNFFDANNEVFGNGISADLGPTQNVLIDRNRFRDQANAGVIFQSTSPSHGFNSDVQIVGNQFENTSPDDVFNENRIVLLSTDDALIQGNTFTNNANNAIQLLGANQGVDVVGNSVSGAGFSAMRIRACSASDCGVDWNPNTNVRILGNDLTGTRDGSGDAAAINVADAGYAGVLQRISTALRTTIVGSNSMTPANWLLPRTTGGAVTGVRARPAATRSSAPVRQTSTRRRAWCCGSVPIQAPSQSARRRRSPPT